MPTIDKKTIDRERETWEAIIEERPELAWVLDDLPDDYDPQAAPEPEEDE